jgi:hypothetical protein
VKNQHYNKGSSIEYQERNTVEIEKIRQIGLFIHKKPDKHIKDYHNKGAIE